MGRLRQFVRIKDIADNGYPADAHAHLPGHNGFRNRGHPYCVGAGLMKPAVFGRGLQTGTLQAQINTDVIRYVE